MTGIRLTGNTIGCPPTQSPPSNYVSPFFEDSSGQLWIKQCFPSFYYFGAARHDIPFSCVPGQDNCKVNTSNDLNTAVGIGAGTYQNRTITNTTNCTLGILLAHDIITSMSVQRTNMLSLTLSERWNGVNHASATVSSEWNLGNPSIMTTHLHSAASPHDVGADASGGSSLRLAPGESATVGAQLILGYIYGSPSAGEMLYASSSAVRIYGYVLG